MRLLFLHGWGLDASLWDDVRAALPEYETIAMDRGYFGSPMTDLPSEPFVAVGHSLGAMLLAGSEGIAGLVAVNGFDRFAGEDAVPPRVVERMRKRFAEAPVEVLADFRARIGAPPAPKHIEPRPLAADLDLLQNPPPEGEGDRPQGGGGVDHGSTLPAASGGDTPPPCFAWSPSPCRGGFPILVLHGGDDPLLPEPMRETVFAGAPRETLAEAGHLLPLTHPAWVAERIRAFAA
jgi:pimeloyl-[acyl-carrier protein] methyl ester esterase